MRSCILLLLAAVMTLPATAQDARVLTDDPWCDQAAWDDNDRARYCEVREIVLSAPRDLLKVDGRQNGGIRIEGWNRDEILVRAKVTGTARTPAEARHLAEAVAIETGPTIYAELPHKRRAWDSDHAWTSVSYEIFVPRRSNLSLNTHNGGIRIANIDGDVIFDALNGGVSLIDLAGHVRGETTNGGVEIELTGREWNGTGLDVETTNGGVDIFIPEGYSAHLETRTVNGKVYFEFPVLMQGRMDDRISTDLGDGGKTIRAVTTNGGVRVRRS